MRYCRLSRLISLIFWLVLHLKLYIGMLILMSHNLLKANDLDIKLLTLRRTN